MKYITKFTIVLALLLCVVQLSFAQNKSKEFKQSKPFKGGLRLNSGAAQSRPVGSNVELSSGAAFEPKNARGVDKDGKGCTDKLPRRKPVKIPNAEIIVWDHPDVCGKLGYKWMSFRRKPRGKYILIRDKKHPFGRVTIDIEDAEKCDEKAAVLKIMIQTNCVSKSDENCKEDGFGCLVFLDNPQMSVEPVYDENHILKKLKIIALTIEAARSWEDPEFFSDMLHTQYKTDSAGIKHNLLVEDFMKSKQFEDIINNRDMYTGNEIRIPNEVFNNFNKLCRRYPWICNRGNGPYNPNAAENLMRAIAGHEDKEKTFRQCFKEAGLSPKGIGFAREIMGHCRKGNTPGMNDAVNKLAVTILSLEEMKELEKERLLAMISTAKNSLAYWNAFRKKNNLPENIAQKIDYEEAGVWDTIGALFGPEGAAGASIGNIIGQMLR